MCFDLTKYITHIKKKELDNIDNISRVINSYELNDLVNFIEFSGDDEDLDFSTTNKCPADFPDRFNITHITSDFNYYVTLDFSANYLIIKKPFNII